MPQRTIAVGDIHGCRTALTSILASIVPTPEDTIVFLGDYVDRGPDSRGVIEDVIALREQCQVVTLRGNHEALMADALADHTGDHLEFWLNVGGQATVDSYGGSIDNIPESHLEFLQQLENFHETETHIFVHANYTWNLPMQRQSLQTLHWKHLIDSFFPPPHRSGKTVIVGHTPQTSGEILDVGHLIGIDTACAMGGQLTAIDVATKQLWQASESNVG